MTRTDADWIAELQSDPAPGVLEELSKLLRGAIVKGTRHQTTLDEPTLDDLTQIATVKVLTNLERFEGRSKFTTWAYSIAVRAAFTELRKAARARTSQELDESGALNLPDTDLSPFDFAERGEIVEVMRRIIAEELSPRQRLALEGELAGRSQEDRLAELGVNRNALYKLVHDARAKVVKGFRAAGICDDAVREAFDL